MTGNGVTELMVDRTKWEIVGAPVPHPGSSEMRIFMHAVTLNNRVYVAGFFNRKLLFIKN